MATQPRVSSSAAISIAMPDSASAGKLFSRFRARALGKGRVAHIEDVPNNFPTPPGTRRKADGFVKVEKSLTEFRGPPKGRYAAEDKAGASFDPKQAARYAKAMEEGWPGIDGVTYFVETESRAKTVASKLRRYENARFYVGYFEAGDLKWVKMK